MTKEQFDALEKMMLTAAARADSFRHDRGHSYMRIERAYQEARAEAKALLVPNTKESTT